VTLQAMEMQEDEFPATVEAGPLSLPDDEEVVVASDIGSFSSCDVWFAVPSAWVSQVTLRLYARLGRARVLLRAVALSNVATTSSGDQRSGIAVSVRGRPCRAFEVSLYTRSAGLVDGHVYLQSWHGGADIAMAPGDDPAPGVSVTARLQGRDSVSGAFVDVVTDDEGRLLVDNPVLGDDYLRLPDVTTAPAPTTGEVRVYYDGGTIFASPPDALSVLGLTIPKRTGTGVNAGTPLVLKSQDGRDVSSGTNSNGGALTLSAGDVGTGGTASTGIGGRLILKVGAGGSAHGTLDLDMATSISNIAQKTRWLVDGIEFASLQQLRVSGVDYTFIRATNGLVCEAVGGTATLKGSSVTLEAGGGNAIYSVDTSGKPRITQTLGNTTAIAAHETVTSFQINHTKPSGTGTTIGATLQVKAQDGQNGTGTQPNSGGVLSLESGAKGASTENAFDGNVVIKTGSTTRISISGNGLDLAEVGKIHTHLDTSAVEHMRFVTDSTEATVPAVPARLAIWQDNGRLQSRTQRDVRHELNCQDTATGAAAKRIYDRLVRATSTTSGTTTVALLVAADLPTSSPTWLARFAVEWGGYNTVDNTIAGGHRRGTIKCQAGTITVATSGANQIVGVDDDSSTGITSGATCLLLTASSEIRFSFVTTTTNNIRFWVRAQITLVQH